MKESKSIRQFPNEPPRRVFSDEDMELIVWESAAGEVEQFQLAYDLGDKPRVIEWRNGRVHHYTLDAGPGDYTQADRTALLRAAAAPDITSMRARFAEAAKDLPKHVQAAVLKVLP